MCPVLPNTTIGGLQQEPAGYAGSACILTQVCLQKSYLSVRASSWSLERAADRFPPPPVPFVPFRVCFSVLRSHTTESYRKVQTLLLLLFASSFSSVEMISL